MFVDLMRDVADTFTDRFLKAQLSFDAADDFGGNGFGGGYPDLPPVPPQAPTKRYNAFGILEDIPLDQLRRDGNGANGAGDDGMVLDATYDGEGELEPGMVSAGDRVDTGPSEPPGVRPVSRPDPTS